MKPQPPFERIGIVSLGALGCAIGRAIRRAWPSALVIGVDGHDALERAVRFHAIDVGGNDLWMVEDAELIVLAGSTDQSVSVLPALDEHVPGAVVVTATCGDAPELIEAAHALPPRMTFVATLLTARESLAGDPPPADARQLSGAEWRVVPAPGESGGGTAAERLRRFVAGLTVGL